MQGARGQELMVSPDPPPLWGAQAAGEDDGEHRGHSWTRWETIVWSGLGSRRPVVDSLSLSSSLLAPLSPPLSHPDLGVMQEDAGMRPIGGAGRKGASRADPELGKLRNVQWTNTSEHGLWVQGCRQRKASLR